MDALGKLEVLARSARYDVSCASSGSHRAAAAPGRGRTFGSAVPMGICHSFTDDGRCVSLLKGIITKIPNNVNV